MAKGVCRCGKVRISGWENGPVLSTQPQCSHKGPHKRKREPVGTERACGNRGSYQRGDKMLGG